MTDQGEIRQTIRVSESRNPDEFAFLLNMKQEGESWASLFLRVTQKAMQHDMGDPQITRIEKEIAELKTLIVSQPATAVQVLSELPPEEKQEAEFNPFGKGFDGW